MDKLHTILEQKDFNEKLKKVSEKMKKANKKNS